MNSFRHYFDGKEMYLFNSSSMWYDFQILNQRFKKKDQWLQAFKRSITTFNNLFAATSNIDAIDFENIYIILSNVKPNQCIHQIWDDIYLNFWDTGLFDCVDKYRCIALHAAVVEQSHKKRYDFDNFDIAAEQILFFISSNAPKIGSNEWFTIIDYAIYFWNLINQSN